VFDHGVVRLPFGLKLALVGLVALLLGSALPRRSHAADPDTPTASVASAAIADDAKPIYLPVAFKSSSTCARVYSAASPWNTKIASSPAYDPQSDYYITGLTDLFGVDPTQYAFPVYEVTSSTPQRTVYLSGAFSNVTDNDTRVIWQGGGSVTVPIPAGAAQSAGTDGNIIFWNRQTGDEWGFFRASDSGNGTWQATNGYHYNTGWDGVPSANSSTFVSRGLGGPYLAGLVRPCEIDQGQIDHAIAFAYDNPSADFVYPAIKSNGSGSGPALPEGARLQLDPKLGDSQIRVWGCTGNCLIIAHALQQYGMIVVDRSSHPKIYAEYEATAHWNGRVTAATVSAIPYSAFKVLKLK